MMDRRRLMGAGAAMAAVIGIGGERARVFAQDAYGTPEASPEAMPGIAPIRWQVESIIASDGMATPVDGMATPTDDMATPTDGEAAPIVENIYTLQFLLDGILNIQADCNLGRATYEIEGENITIDEGITTLVACEDMATSDQFWATLEGAETWGITTEYSDVLTITAADGSSLVLNPTLQGVTWQWQEFQSGDGSLMVADDPTRFTLEFFYDGSVQAQVDCNSGRGDLVVTGSSIELVLATTRKLCSDDSQGGQYLDWLGQVTSYVIRGDTLNLALPMDAGILVFKAYVEPEEATPVA